MSERRPFTVSVHPLCVFGLALLLAFNDLSTLGGMLLSVLCHESGHLLVALFQRRRVCALRVSGRGLELAAENAAFSYRADALLHLGGPVMNLIAALVCLALIRIRPSEMRFFVFYMNLSMFLFHLLPHPGLDGGRALYCELCRRGDLLRADRISRLVGSVSITLFFLCGAVLFWKSSLHLCLGALLLFCLGAVLEQKKAPAW